MGVGEDLFEVRAPDAKRFSSQVSTGEGDEVEHDVVGRSSGGELAGPGAGGCHALQQGGEVQPVVTPDDELAVDHDVAECCDGLGDLGVADSEVGTAAGLQVRPRAR